MGNYVAKSDIEDTISVQTVIRLYDDDGDGIADASAVARVIASAEALVNSRISRA